MAQPNHASNTLNDVDTIFKKYQERIIKFEEEVCEFPVDNNRIISDEWKEHKASIYEHMQSCYPLVHGSVVSLVYDFLLIKKRYGSEIEKKVYSNMTMVQFFNRLATKRCVVFYQSYDSYLLRNGYNDSGNWEYIGTQNEEKVDKYDVNPQKKPKLNDYLSYDELIISALCGISSKTHFINNGDRRNCGRINKNNKYYPCEGIYMGLIGARFEKSGYMEHSLMAITNEQNTINNGYGQIEEKEEKKPSSVFDAFYDRSYLPIYDELKKEKEEVNNRYYEKSGWGHNQPFLDKFMFKQRIRISLELFLFDADDRANKSGLSAFCHIVGLGTGVWSFRKSIQDQLIVEVTSHIICQTHLPHISCVYFAWMDQDCMNKSIFEEDNNNVLYLMDKSGHKIYVKSGRRAPADKLEEAFEDCLTVAMYAWDSNAFPGNEYYHGMLSASGDPAAASCSTISFVQNSEINKEYINGENTRVYFYNPKTQQYEFNKLGDMKFEKNKEKWLKKSMQSKQQLVYRDQ